jgi:hypothetical protein
MSEVINITDQHDASFQKIWKILEENAAAYKELRESQKETARQMEETDRKMEETARQIKETDWQIKETDRQIKETDRQIKEYNKRFGDMNNRFGEIVEYMVAPKLREKFKEMGLIFENTYQNADVSSEEHDISFEIDILLGNGDKAMLVEVKTKLRTEHINDHIERLEKMRKYADIKGDNRTFLGAVAGVIITKDVKKYALKQGFYVIEPSGETFNITTPNGEPKTW